MPSTTRFLTVFLCTGTLAVSACSKSDDFAPASAPSPQQSNSAPPASTGSSREAFIDLPAPYNEADYNLGRRTFKQCGACHTTVPGGQNLVGPNLYGVFGREAGTFGSYPYSNALRNAGFVWTPERVEEWLSSPNAYLPGNNMSFAGVRRPEDRHAVIAYLMVQTGYGETAQAGEADAEDPT